MFPRINNSQPKDQKVQEEIKAENKPIQPMGNQAAQFLPQVLQNIGNEAMDDQIDDHYVDNFTENMLPSSLAKKNPKKEPERDHYAENMLFPPLHAGGRAGKNFIEDEPETQSVISRRPKRKKKSGRKNADQPDPFKANAPIEDLVSPGLKSKNPKKISIKPASGQSAENKEAGIKAV